MKTAYSASLAAWLVVVAVLTQRAILAQCDNVGDTSPDLYSSTCVNSAACAGAKCLSDVCYSCGTIGYYQTCVPPSYCGLYTFCQDSIGCAY